MKQFLMIALTSAAISLAMPTFASAAQVTRDTQAVRAEQATTRATLDKARHSRQTETLGARALGEGVGGENGPYANPYRVYPPSCMADPLPADPSGPVWSGFIDLAAYNQNLNGFVREEVEILIWRVPCSSDAYDKAITLMRIQRSNAHEGDTNQYIAFPGVRAEQDPVQFDDPNGHDVPRFAVEPNTIITMVSVDAAMVYSTTYVLETFPLSDRLPFDYTLAFSLRLDNFISDGNARQYIFEIPDYVPTSSSYPTAFMPLPINGYMSTGWYDPAHSGEGMIVSVYETAGGYMYAFNWFTYGPDGRPFWLTGNAGYLPGSRSVTVPVFYRDNGGFSGNFGSASSAHPWGSLTVEYSDCNHMQLSFSADAGLPAFVPSGSGNRDWVRVANVNGLTCE